MAIKIENLSLTLNNKKILENVNFEILNNKSTVIIGQSGSGKSVLVKSIIGIINQWKGSVKIDGVEIKNLSYDKMLEMMKNIGFLFQSNALFDSMSVMENIVFRCAQERSMTDQEKREFSIDLLKKVGLSEDILDKSISQISGGMQKRVALARAISMDPKYLFLDEPITGLDPATSNAIDKLILKLMKDHSLTVLTITHSISSVRNIADYVVFIKDGKVRWQGEKGDFFNSKDEDLQKFIRGEL